MQNSKFVKKQYDKSFQIKIIKDYNALQSLRKVADINHITTRQVVNILDDNKIDHFYKRKILLDETFFDKFEDPNIGPDVMYWCGFIAADGNVINTAKSRSYFLTIKLASADKDHLFKFKNSLSSNAKINLRLNKGGIRANKIWKDSMSSVIVLNSKYLVNSLEKFNIVPNKSNIYKFPKIINNNPLLNNFIRGYFDGDGSISFRNGKLRLNFYGTLEFLSEISQIIANNCLISEHKPFKNRTIYNLEYNGKEAIFLIKWIYGSANIYLDRKYNLIKNIIT